MPKRYGGLGRSKYYRRALMKSRAKMAVARRANLNRKVATVGLVKKMIHQNMENKLAGTAFNVQFNAQIDSVYDAYGLLPTIPLGTGDNARIGNRITPRGLLVQANVYITPDTTLPYGTVLMPRIICFSQKSTNGFQPGISVDFTRLLDHGQGEHAFLGDLASYKDPINTDSFKVYKDIKTRICLGNGDANPNVISKTFKFWVPCPKTLLYDDGQTYPQNFAPFICVGFATGQGFITPPESTFLTMDWTTTLYYEDA